MGRPRLHHLALKAFANEIHQERKWTKVLDLACGTGHSSTPLMEYADSVVAIDVSKTMIEIARHNHPEIDFIVGTAEDLPRSYGKCDAMFIANGFHWFDKGPFAETIKTNPHSKDWIVSYGLGAPSRMHNNPHYEKWYRNEYWGKYPNPQRKAGSFPSFVDNLAGVLSGYSNIQFTHNLELSYMELHTMLTTQSNIHQAIENGECLSEIDAYLAEVLPSFYTQDREIFPFDIKVEYAFRI